MLDTQRLQKILVITRIWITRIWMVTMVTVILDPKMTTRIKMILIVTRIWMILIVTFCHNDGFLYVEASLEVLQEKA